MCGIAGYFSHNLTDTSVLDRMEKIIAYRGPDDKGVAIFTGVKDTSPFRDTAKISQSKIGLAHRRLSIVDLSQLGHQPMSYSNERFWIVYNGEIYNHLELKEELLQLGHQFKSQSDTEVILAAYTQWGEECLSRFNGMWAFAIFDNHEQKIFLARDRFGVKPLYYWVSPEGVFYFASEIKQFSVVDTWVASLNKQRAYDFLNWGLCDHTEETMFEGVYQIRPGNSLTLNQDSQFLSSSPVATQQWYNLPSDKFKGTYEDARNTLRALLKDSVSLRLRADVTVGSCLSGGLDSSSIVCILNDLIDDKAMQKTFSSISDVSKYSEQKWIKEVVRHTKVNDHYVTPSFDQLFSKLEELTWHQDEPFGSTSIFAQWNVFELAKKNDVLVMLDGQGADEQLGGYHGFFAPLLFGYIKQRKFIKFFQELKIIHKLHNYSYGYLLAQVSNMLLPGFIKDPAKKIIGRANGAPDWLDIKKLGAQRIDPNNALGTYTDSVDSLCRSQLTSSNLQALLHWEDRNSMAHSIESRVPFLDFRLVEFVMSLPDEYKVSKGVTKLILRDSMSGIIPDKIKSRMDKLGFVTPEEIWIRELATEDFRNNLSEAINILGGIITPSVLNYFNDVVEGNKPFNFSLWRIISFARWVKVFNVRIA